MYGDAWEKHPIEPGDLYEAGDLKHRYICAPFSPKALDYLMGEETVDLIYTDPPWDTRIANQFRKWVGMDSLPKGGFDNLLEGVAFACSKYSSKYVAIDMGIRSMDVLKDKLTKYGAKQFDVFFPTYGNGLEYALWIGTFKDGVEKPEWDADPTGQNSEKGFYTSNFLLRNLKPKSLLDMFIGQAQYLVPFLENGVRIFGLEFNKRKLANLHYNFIRKGLHIEKVNYGKSRN